MDLLFSKMKYLDMVKIIFYIIMTSILMSAILTHIKMRKIFFWRGMINTVKHVM